jgi:hypothetical protein
MKTIAFALSLLAAGALSLQSQDYTSGGGDVSKKMVPKPEKPAETRERLRPVPSGVIYEMSQKGLVIIWPGAGPEYGKGEAFLTAPMPPQQEIGGHKNGMPFDFGGIKLIGFDF